MKNNFKSERQIMIKKYNEEYYTNTDKDHIHILFESYPTLNLSTFINSYKSASSRKIRTVFKSMLCRFY